MLRVEHLSLSIGKTQILKDINIQVSAGEFVSIVGPSGSGKSTLLNAICGLGPGKMSGKIVRENEAQDIGYLFQDDALLPWKSVKKNLRMGMRYRGYSREQQEKKIRFWLEKLRISEHEDKFPGRLSGGQRKRAAIAQVMVLDPSLVLMDEPFASLDAIVRAEIVQDLIHLYRKKNNIFILVTHDLEEAITLSDRIYLLSNGPSAKISKEYTIDIPYFENLLERKTHSRFNDLYKTIWQDLHAIIQNKESLNLA